MNTFWKILLLLAVGVVVSLSYRLIRADWVSFRRAEVLFARGDCDTSMEIHRKLLRSGFPKRALIEGRICECLLRSGHLSAASRLASRIDPEAPDAGEIWMRLAGVFSRYGHFADARKFYRQGLNVYPDSRNGRFYFAQVLVALGEFDLADREFRTALQTGQPGFDLAMTAGSDGPPVPEREIRLDLGRCLVYKGDLSGSRELLEELVQMEPGFVDARVDLARIVFWQGDPVRALALLNVADDTRLPRAGSMLLAELLMIARDYSGTESTLNRILEEDPNDDEARLKLAEVLSWGRKLAESSRHYRLLVSRRPDDAQIRRKYAQVLHWRGRHREAAEQLRRSLYR